MCLFGSVHASGRSILASQAAGRLNARVAYGGIGAAWGGQGVSTLRTDLSPSDDGSGRQLISARPRRRYSPDTSGRSAVGARWSQEGIGGPTATHLASRSSDCEEPNRNPRAELFV